ncbi:MAG: dihydroorotate dehydrogenase [Deltaproteobacteria bacterium]|jgi:dihydroorotate dehydrogenase (NAD+) catalytic subunit|nr:dihydroorotate dehydrogenase [Deltaproteobacteria bacterium]
MNNPQKLILPIFEVRSLAQDTFLLRVTKPNTEPFLSSPGQFAKLGLPPGDHEATAFPLLDRPFAIHKNEPEALSFLIRKVGRATRILSTLQSLDEIQLTGPLGKGFPEIVPELQNSPLLLAAGGTGLGPIGDISRWNLQKHTLIYGEKTGNSQIPVDYLKSLYKSVYPVTEDGSGYGEKGLVTTVLSRLLKESPRPILACGPPAMLRAVANLGREARVPVWVSAEVFMACGLGVCLSCSFPLKEKKRTRLCVDGPVLDAFTVDFEEILDPLPPPVLSFTELHPPHLEPFTPDLSVSLGKLKLKNPVIAASGAFGYGLELLNFTPPEKLGAVIVKGLSLEPWKGNPGPRALEYVGGLMNAIGLENMGIIAFLNQALPELKKTGAIVGANILGRSPEDYALLAERLANSPIDFIEINVSCPNLKDNGGLSFGTNPELAAKITQKVTQKAPHLPVVVKLPPLVSDIRELAKKVEESGAAAISLINTLPGLTVDLERKKPRLKNVVGGLSGPPIKPLALRQVYFTSQVIKIPVLGLGGILNATDALEFILAGASAIQLGTAILQDPQSPLKILEGITDHLTRLKENLNTFRGSLVIP